MSAHSPAPEVTWVPTQEQLENTRLTQFRDWVRLHRGIEIADYEQMWRWSTTDLAGFWGALREFFGIVGDGFDDSPALVENRMPGAVWYPQARLNFAENVLRHVIGREEHAAVINVSEDGSVQEWTWRELASRVAILSERLRALGVTRGDRVGAVLPNIPETIVAMLATASIGAIWTVSSPDLAPSATLDRLRSLEPVVLIGTPGYTFKGKWIDTTPALNTIAAELPSVRSVLLVGGGRTLRPGSAAEVVDLDGLPTAELQFERVGFSDPLWVLFSSGTTGAPKGIVHGHGGILLEASKAMGLQFGLGSGDRYFTAANTAWMVWNTLVNTLSVGAAVVTYSGAPTWPRADRQFEVASLASVTMFSTGAAYLSLVEKSGLTPAHDWDLAPLHTLMSTGSVLSPATWRWVHDAVKSDVHLSSDSGGTDICSGFIGGNPWQPVYVGELQGSTLGAAIEVRREDGTEAAVNEIGEMVITQPMPSMPVGFWNDREGELYKAAYFASDPSVWTHGDWISRTPRGGFILHGRSDATLNRDGVRMGSADVYAAVHTVDGVRNSVVLGIETGGGGYWMPLFVELSEGVELDEALQQKIRDAIRGRASARHVPDTIEQVPGIPTTHAGKRIEVPLKKLFLGRTEDDAVNRGSLVNPEAVDWFVARASRFRAGAGIDLADTDNRNLPTPPPDRKVTP
ncbi:acetoacetate--CoA ligase [Homoserinimonas hongtaonis]|uniref:acetoacetate--CoA ligase n=1 Tax=Homoserinimonas hongtaonis TaxID=2079791 RepID=UPI000D35BFEE|nr:acetoacetate--CoA ligase [Salinibacterium hongtaonis]AWB90314.1 acetoacetate--CoA ligase [Salinibacterium hongtaonis]